MQHTPQRNILLNATLLLNATYSLTQHTLHTATLPAYCDISALTTMSVVEDNSSAPSRSAIEAFVIVMMSKRVIRKIIKINLNLL
ncbi:hypothetical protein EV426DRAFT_597765 [Tirmania nivea]|nr:hypothetical protein EV426DRAFT_597765 [Tirmania nivea]